MNILIEVKVTRVIGKPKGQAAVAEALKKLLPVVNQGIEVEDSGYMILSVEHKE